MEPLHYAVVAYVRHPVGDFIERLRRELHPALPHLPAHVTILPPRLLQGSENSALEQLEEICSGVNPFEVALGDVETFIPVTPTVFIRVAHGAYRMRELHDRLNRQILSSEEDWPYMPHLTIVKMSEAEPALGAFHLAQRRWNEYLGSRRLLLEELTFVRESPENKAGAWVDLAPIPLGRRLVSKDSR